LIARNADAAGRRVQHAGGVHSPIANQIQNAGLLSKLPSPWLALAGGRTPHRNRSAQRDSHPRFAFASNDFFQAKRRLNASLIKPGLWLRHD
jgi:hypothetical protein